MESKYDLGYFGKILMKKENSGSLVINDDRVGTTVYKIEGKNKQEFEKELLKTIESEKKFLLAYTNDLRKLSKRIKENGLEKTSQYYQTLENKTEGGKK